MAEYFPGLRQQHKGLPIRSEVATAQSAGNNENSNMGNNVGNNLVTVGNGQDVFPEMGDGGKATPFRCHSQWDHGLNTGILGCCCIVASVSHFRKHVQARNPKHNCMAQSTSISRSYPMNSGFP